MFISLTPKSFYLQNSFEDRRVRFASSYCLILFSDLHRTPLKSGLKPFASFQKGFVKIKEIFQLIGRERLKFKR
jgi:hypothetical protein